MKKKALVGFFSISILVIAATVYGKRGQEIRPAPKRKPVSAAEPVPEQIVYSSFFHLVVNVKQQADETRSSGKNAASLDSYFQKHIGLDNDQARLLNDIADQCVAGVAVKDELAQRIIINFRSKFPNGRVPKGTKLPPPPPELAGLQQERNAIILKARDNLLASLGESGTNKVKNYIAANIASNIKPIPLQK
ncbi:MAG: hypothetical protein ACREAB_17830 [Blastocatellia bacterium]